MDPIIKSEFTDALLAVSPFFDLQPRPRRSPRKTTRPVRLIDSLAALDEDIKERERSLSPRKSAKKEEDVTMDSPAKRRSLLKFEDDDFMQASSSRSSAKLSFDGDGDMDICSSPSKKRKREFAAPEVYAHLSMIPDYLEPNLDVHRSPGQKSAQEGHHYAHPTNHFWTCLHRSGFTPTKLRAAQDFTLPQTFRLGLVRVVSVQLFIL
ncbi:hypothetical protein C8J56DRAFT_958975 [Mycena floridula]|nr:hypothetical protein C8J56DRAFT_958975 [Mycena floridula]